MAGRVLLFVCSSGRAFSLARKVGNCHICCGSETRPEDEGRTSELENEEELNATGIGATVAAAVAAGGVPAMSDRFGR